MAQRALDRAKKDPCLGLGMPPSSLGRLSETVKVFCKVSRPTVHDWNTIISAYARNSEGQKALEFFHRMMQEGSCPNRGSYVGALKACASIGDLKQGRSIHKQIIADRLETDMIVGSTLVEMYAKCGRVDAAHTAFENLEQRNVVSWAFIITGYAQTGHGHMALDLYGRMHKEGIQPDRVMFLCIMKACSTSGAIAHGMLIHHQIINVEMESDIAVNSALVDFYIKHGSLEEAHTLFRLLPNPNVVSWSTLISGYAQQGHDIVALELFEKMQHDGVDPGRVAFLSVLKACGTLGISKHGMVIHAYIVERDCFVDTIIANTLVDMYAKCGNLAEARAVFDQLPTHSIVSWDALIAGYCQHGNGELALELFEQMQQDGLGPDRVSFVSALKACSNIQAIDQGRKIHYKIIGSGLDLDLSVGSSLVDMYVNCGYLNEAWTLFRRLPTRDVVMWSTILTGYTEQGCGLQVLELYQEMLKDGIEPDSVLFVCVLKASAIAGALLQGRLIHKQIVISGYPVSVDVRSTLIGLYATCGSMQDAQKVFDESLDRNAASWGAMIVGHTQYGQGHAALDILEKMQEEGFKPEKATFVSSFKACGTIGALVKGRCIHDQVLRREFESDLIVGNVLVDVYAKCGSLAEAQNVFDNLLVRDVVSWGALIGGYATSGNWMLATHCLSHMQQQGLKPDGVIFTSLLGAYSHAGLIEEGQNCLKGMKRNFGLVPTIEHYNCMIDLLGRVGHLKEAKALLDAMPVSPNAISWVSLLASCRTHGDVEQGRQCFNKLVHLDPDEATSYAIISSLFADADLWDEVERIQEMRKCSSAWKEPGKAWIEIKNKVHEFVVGGRIHPLAQDIYTKLNRVSKIAIGEGSMPQVGMVMIMLEADDEFVYLQ